MNLHEYQAKELLAGYGLPVQGGILAANGEEAAAAFDKLGGKFAVIKAQVHAGGRGKAGGVKVVKSRDEAKQVAESLIGKNLVTYQTDANGQPVNSVLVCEDMYPVQTELYLGENSLVIGVENSEIFKSAPSSQSAKLLESLNKMIEIAKIFAYLKKLGQVE